MGSCHCADVEDTDRTESISKYTRKNQVLVHALIYACIESDLQGASVKFMNISRLMADYYAQLGVQRQLLKDAALTTSELHAFDLTLKEELTQLQHSNRVLKRAFKKITKSTFLSSTENIEAYLRSCQTNDTLEETHQRVLTLYSKSVRCPDRAVKLLTRGVGLSADETSLILTVCQSTTHLYSSKEHAIRYTIPSRIRRTESIRGSTLNLSRSSSGASYTLAV